MKQAQSTAQSEAKPVTEAGATTVTSPDSGPAVIVFGFDQNRIPQAAWFSARDAALAARAASLMGLRVLKVEDDAHRELAGRLRQGQVYAADRTFAPAVQREVFDALCALAGPITAASAPGAPAESSGPASRPASWNEIGVGSLVIAHESPEDGWWEALVVALEGETLVLRWRDYARQPCVRRGRFEVALLPPQAA